MTHTGELRKGLASPGAGRKGYNDYSTTHKNNLDPSDAEKARRTNSGVIEGPHTSVPSN